MADEGCPAKNADEMGISLECHRRTKAVWIPFHDANTLDRTLVFAVFRKFPPAVPTTFYEHYALKDLPVLGCVGTLETAVSP